MFLLQLLGYDNGERTNPMLPWQTPLRQHFLTMHGYEAFPFCFAHDLSLAVRFRATVSAGEPC